VQALLTAGAEPEWKDEAEETALLKAAANGHVAVVNLLGPHAPEDERDLARAFLSAFGASHAPDFQYDESRLKKKAIELVARAADFVGNEDPLKRVERVDRAKKNHR
jgi:ankyrin repeat protein